MVNEFNGNGEIEDKRIIEYMPLISPYHLKQQIPLSSEAEYTVRRGRRSIIDILRGSHRIIVVVGPCSIHDVEAAKDYARRLSELKEKVKDKFEIVMRANFEKPRTAVGWKGLLYEPYLDGVENINEGLTIARELLKYVGELRLSAGTEFLDPFVPQYISDLVSWGWIGARTVESPQHRQMASGLSMPIGFKNNTQGSIEAAVNAVLAATHPHSFLGIDQYGTPSIVSTKGNSNTHIILRGSNDKPNYDREIINEAQAKLREAGLEGKLMIDCSHGNSRKDYRLQPVVFEEVTKQIVDGNKKIIGLMLESNIREGAQKPNNPNMLQYGVSVTDPCIGWETTERLVLNTYHIL